MHPFGFKVSKIAPDGASKGFHVHVDGVELALRQGQRAKSSRHILPDEGRRFTPHPMGWRAPLRISDKFADIRSITPESFEQIEKRPACEGADALQRPPGLIR